MKRVCSQNRHLVNTTVLPMARTKFPTSLDPDRKPFPREVSRVILEAIYVPMKVGDRTKFLHKVNAAMFQQKREGGGRGES